MNYKKKLKIADCIAIMNDGEIVQLDTPENILRSPINDFVKGFIDQECLNQNNALPAATDLMLPKRITLTPEHVLSEAVHLMKAENIDSLFIISAFEDLLEKVYLEEASAATTNGQMKIEEVMSTENIRTLNESDVVIDAAKLFQDSDIHAIPSLALLGFMLSIKEITIVIYY